MKVLMAAVLTLAFAGAAVAFEVAAPVAINEVDYDNPSTDATEWIELVGAAGTDLTGWSIVLVNGSGGAVYGTYTLAGSIPNDFTSAWGGDGGFYVLGNFDAEYAAAFPGALDYTPVGYPATNAIQNGTDDVIQLYDAAGNLVDEWEPEDSDGLSVTGQSQPFSAFDSAGAPPISGYTSLGRLGYSFDQPYFVFDDSTMTGVNRYDSATNNVLSGMGPAWTAPAYTGAAFSTVGPYTEAGTQEIDWSGTSGFGPNRGPTPGTFNNANYGAGGQDPYTINIIPEPATLALLGLGGLALLRRRS